MTQKFKDNKKILIDARNLLRGAKEEYIVVRDLSLDSDLLKSLTGVNGSVEGEYNDLHKFGNAVIDLKHIIEMAKFKMRREIRRVRKA